MDRASEDGAGFYRDPYPTIESTAVTGETHPRYMRQQDGLEWVGDGWRPLVLAGAHATDAVCLGHYTAALADGAVALGRGSVAYTTNEVAVSAFGRTVRFHHHRGIVWRNFRRALATRTGLKVAVWLVSLSKEPGFPPPNWKEALQ